MARIDINSLTLWITAASLQHPTDLASHVAERTGATRRSANKAQIASHLRSRVRHPPPAEFFWRGSSACMIFFGGGSRIVGGIISMKPTLLVVALLLAIDPSEAKGGGIYGL